MRMFFYSLLLSVVLVVKGFAQDKGTNFQHISLAEALKKVAAAGEKSPKLVFVDCYTSWCVPCAEMARTVFPEKVIGDFMNPRFISVKLDMEKDTEGREVLKKYGITAYPTFLILDAKGEEVNRIVGGAKTQDFLEKLEAALKEENSIHGLKAAFEKEKTMATGLPYMKALIGRSMDPSGVFNVLFDSLSDAYRFNTEYLGIVFSTIRFGDPLFKKIMLEKPRIDRAIGEGVINRMVYDMVRKHMYLIASESGDRYNVHYTPQEVEFIAYTMALLNLPLEEPETHMFRIALYVANKDMDGMIGYFRKYIWNLKPEAYKGILEGMLTSKYPRLTDAQKKAVRQYFEFAKDIYGRQSKNYGESLERMK